VAKNIHIQAGLIEFFGELNESITATTFWNALPITGKANVWGNEVYFTIPVVAEQEETAVEVVDLGTIAYWPPGRALCFFFGPTPASEGDEIRAASAVNVLGKITGDPHVFASVKDGTLITINKA
jgi:hypothetical protein